jgi:hypothetical protein
MKLVQSIIEQYSIDFSCVEEMTFDDRFCKLQE